MNIVIVLLLQMFTNINPPTENETGISISINNIKFMGGHMKVAIYNNEKSYMSDKVYRYHSVEVKKSGNLKIRSFNIEEGTYSICIFHDQNYNGKLDKNFLGIPTEPYGFSNNPKIFFSSPGFKDTMVIVEQGQYNEVTIDLR